MNSRSRVFATALAVLAAGAAGAGIALGIASALGDLNSKTVVTQSTEAPASLAQISATGGGKSLTIPEIYERTAPGVVQVTSTQIVKAQQVNPFFQTPSQKVQALGSGFVIDKQGDIVTNYHVIQGATSIQVLFSNNVTTKATVVGTDISTDLAVLRVKVSPGALTPLAFGNSAAMEVGDPVVAIGNPFGLDRTVTSGIVSAIYNVGAGTLATNGFPLLSQNNFPIPAIQTDAAINHGNSGGPLINSLGQVIGVNSQIETGGTSQGNVGIGFAIQSDTVKQIVAQILKTGKATHAFLGVGNISEITPEVARLYRLPVDHGLLFGTVRKGTGAAKAGLKAGTRTVTVAGQSYSLGGDIIVAVDGTSVGSSYGKLADTIAQHKPGDKLTLEIYRGNQKMTVTVTLGNRP
jgi:S1-C subfamily serine protease